MGFPLTGEVKQWVTGVGVLGQAKHSAPGPMARLDPMSHRTHMQNIKDITSSIHFEAYRVKRLNEGNSAMSNGVEEKEPEEAQEM